MGQVLLLPYPRQLPQDYYKKNLSIASPVVTTPPTTEVPTTPTEPDSGGVATSSGGIYYGDLPPANPQNGWLWTQGAGRLYMYTDPGIWSQIGTNW